MILSILFGLFMLFSYGQLMNYIFKIEYEDVIIYLGNTLGMGTVIFTILATFTHLCHLPLHWYYFGIIAVMCCSTLFIDRKIPSKMSIPSLLVMLTIIIFGGVYLHGALGYTWLEDDDPWEHALVVSYITEEHSAWDTANLDLRYSDPYPSAYDIFMGMMNQINNNVNLTLKYFNVLLITIGLLFAYAFLSLFMKSNLKGFIATFTLAVLPCYMSHFIWSQTLGLILLFPTLYCFEKGYKFLSALGIMSIFLGQPSCAIVSLAIIGLYLLFRKFKGIIEYVGGCLLGSIYWIIMIVKYGFSQTLSGMGFSVGLLNSANDTSGGIIYGIKDFVLAPMSSRMDQPTGIGIVACLLVLCVIFWWLINFKKWTSYNWFVLALFAVTLIAVEGNMLPIKLYPHRMWVFLSIPIAILVAESVYLITNNKWKWFILVVILGLLVWTSGIPKASVELSMWPAGVKLPIQEAFDWSQVNISKGSSIYLMDGYNNEIPVGFGYKSCSWCEGYNTLKHGLLNLSTSDIDNTLQSMGYEYLAVGSSSIFSLQTMYNETELKELFTNKLNSIIKDNNYEVVYNGQNLLIVKI